MWCFVCLFLVVSTSEIDFLVSKMTYYVSSETLSPTHSLTGSLYGAGAVGAVRSDGFSPQLQASYVAPTLSSMQNALVASNSGVLTQRNPGMISCQLRLLYISSSWWPHYALHHVCLSVCLSVCLHYTHGSDMFTGPFSVTRPDAPNF